MNLPAISKISLYRLTQEGEMAPSPTQISPPILKMMVGALVDFWLEQEVNTQLWLKLPPTYSWQTEIEAYQSQGKLQQLFYCDSGANNPLVSTENQVSPNGKIIPVQLQSNYWLGKEFFLIVLSPSLCSMILAQWQSPKSDKANSPYLKTVITFQPKVIARVLAGIKIASLRPSTQFLQTNQFSLPEKVNATAKVWEQLLLKQLQRTEGMFQSQIFGELNSTISNLKETLSLKEELLCSLVRELRPPITTMKTALSLLQSNQLKKLQRERYLSLIERECQKQNDLIFALVELININQTANSDTQPYVKIEDLIPGIVSTYQPLAQEQGIQLGYTISPNLPLAACSSNSLKQI
ncbi:MAG: histidine kinase, partial [Cyanobacteria bacterium J083]